MSKSAAQLLYGPVIVIVCQKFNYKINHCLLQLLDQESTVIRNFVDCNKYKNNNNKQEYC